MHSYAKKIILWLFLVMPLFVASAAAQEAAAVKNEPPLGRYESDQKFKGPVFFKDDNVWIYNKSFADEFGMPKAGIQDIKNYDAAAFRVEEQNYRLYGATGIEERFLIVNHCVLDVYFDESKYKLPWATDQKADWLGFYNSTRWIKDARGRSGATPDVPKNVTANELFGDRATLHPFMDFKTNREIFWLSNAYVDTGSGEDMGKFNAISVYGYQRNLFGRWTMISFGLPCYKSSRLDTIFRLEAREKIMSPTLGRFYEFYIPAGFVLRMNDAIALKKEKDADFYRRIYADLLNKINKSSK